MNKRLLFLALFITSLVYSQNKIPEGTLSDEQMLIEYAIYFLDDDNTNPESVKNMIRKEYPNLKIMDSIPGPEEVKGSQITITPIDKVRELFPPADLEYLKYKGVGLTDQEKEALQKSKYVLLLDFVCEKDLIVSTIKNGNQLVNKIVKNKNAVIYDSETRETFSKEYWSKNRLVHDNSIDISQHITIHFYRKNDYCRAITLGMLKFGLPDICIEELSCNSGTELASFINLTAQTMLEKQKLDYTGKLQLSLNSIQNKVLKDILLTSSYENAEKKATINLVEGIWEVGDPQNRLIEIGFSKNNPQIEHDQLLKKLFGFEDKITMLSHNEELLAASKRAKSKVPELRKMFLDGLGFNSSLLMKFPFENSEGEREWMWVEIVKWKGNTVKGLLQNEPAIVKSLKAGQNVSKNVNDMFDYILYKSDGTQEGNETGKIIMKMQN